MKRTAKPGDVVLIVDLGATAIGANALDLDGKPLLAESVEVPSETAGGPTKTLSQMMLACRMVLTAIGKTMADVVAIGLDTPGPANIRGEIGPGGSVNFGNDAWANCPIAQMMQDEAQVIVFYLNDGTAAAVYAYWALFGSSVGHSLVVAAIGSGLGGGAATDGRPLIGHEGYSTELGHVHVPMDGILEQGQPVPRCNCGRTSDAESVASLTGIRLNLLPWFLGQNPGHPLTQIQDPKAQAYQVRTLAMEGDAMCLKMFEQQARVLARLFEQLMMVGDYHYLVIGGGIAETDSTFREWFRKLVEAELLPRLWPKQRDYVKVVFMPDGDEAGMRGVGLYALQCLKDEGLLGQ